MKLCPKCKKTGYTTIEEAVKLFGLRVLNGSYEVVQSYCRVCRSSKKKPIFAKKINKTKGKKKKC